MQLRLVLLSVTCFACLIPSAVPLHPLAAIAVAGQAKADIVSTVNQTIAAKKAAVSQAASNIASIAAQGVAQKGEALKKAAAAMAGAVINGTVSIGSTIAKAGLNMIIAKFSGMPTLVTETPTNVTETPTNVTETPTNVTETPTNVTETPTNVTETPMLRDIIVEETVVQEPIAMEYNQAFRIPVQRSPISTVSVDVKPQNWDILLPSRRSQPVWTMDDAVPSFEIVSSANSPYFYDIVQNPQVYGPLMKTFQFGKK